MYLVYLVYQLNLVYQLYLVYLVRFVYLVYLVCLVHRLTWWTSYVLMCGECGALQVHFI